MIVLAATELMVGMAVLWSSGARVPSMAAAALFAFLGIGVWTSLLRGGSGRPCGCLGAKKRLSRALALQDFGLSLMAMACVATSRLAVATFGAVGLLLFFGPALYNAVLRHGRRTPTTIRIPMPGPTSLSGS